MADPASPAGSIPYATKDLLAVGPQRRLRGRRLDQIAFPIGGLGAGSVCLSGRGALVDWEIFNRPGKGNRPAYTFFVLWARREGGEPVTRVLEARPSPPFTGASGVPRQYGAGLPHLTKAAFRGEYPFASVRFQDRDLPLSVSLEAFNPFIPLNPEDSALPVLLLTYTLKNTSKDPVDATLCGSMLNFVGYHHEGPLDLAAPWAGSNVNELITADGFAGLRLTTRKYKPGHPQFGSAVLATPAGHLTYQTRWSREGWFDTLQRFWDQFSSTGRLTDDDSVDPSPDGRTDVGSLAARVHLAPKAQVAVPFLITWHFPQFEHYWGGETSKGTLLSPHYAPRFQDAWEVAAYVVENRDRLETETRRFHSTLFATTVPTHVVDAVSSQLSTLKTNTCQWFADGTFHAFEGCSDREGCCMGSCTHVWNYEQSLAYLFPSLERDMRVTDFKYNTSDDGYMAFRHPMPRGAAFTKGMPAADGQMGCLMKLYREWQLSGDRAFLEELWPHAERALRFAWTQWDRDQDGVMEGIQHNTYDIEFHGPNPMMGTFYLGALRVGAELAAVVGDPEAAARYRDLYECGRAKLDAELWNGEHYIQKYDPQVATKYQFGTGCLSDQLLGQWFSHVVQLGYLLPRKHVRIALRSVFRHNWRSRLADHPNCQRIYALDDEAGLLLCSWPQGGRPQLPFPYSDEVWTGIEYQVAAHLIWEGFLEEGLAVVKGVRDRHDGERRNPWNEPECGHHYARALSSWSLLLALSGFRYSAPDRSIGFAPKLNAERFRTFWSVDSGWGLFSQRIRKGRMACKLRPAYGALRIEVLELAWAGAQGAGVVLEKVACGRERLPATLVVKGDALTVRFSQPVTIGTDQTLQVVILSG